MLQYIYINGREGEKSIDMNLVQLSISDSSTYRLFHRRFVFLLASYQQRRQENDVVCVEEVTSMNGLDPRHDNIPLVDDLRSRCSFRRTIKD